MVEVFETFELPGTFEKLSMTVVTTCTGTQLHNSAVIVPLSSFNQKLSIFLQENYGIVDLSKIMPELKSMKQQICLFVLVNVFCYFVR